MKREYTVNIVKDNINVLQEVIEVEDGYSARDDVADCMANADDCWNDVIKDADFVELRYSGLFENDDWSDCVTIDELFA